MNYNIKGTGFDMTDEVRSYVEKRVSMLDGLAGKSARVDVIVAYLASEEKQYKAEMTLSDTKYPLHAESRGRALHEAIDLVTGELVAELTNAKKKRRSVFRRGAGRVKDYLRGWRSSV